MRPGTLLYIMASTKRHPLIVASVPRVSYSTAHSYKNIAMTAGMVREHSQSTVLIEEFVVKEGNLRNLRFADNKAWYIVVGAHQLQIDRVLVFILDRDNKAWYIVVAEPAVR